jgi:hypothetical protein
MHMPAVHSKMVENSEGVKTEKIDNVDLKAKMVQVESVSTGQSAAQSDDVADAP